MNRESFLRTSRLLRHFVPRKDGWFRCYENRGHKNWKLWDYLSGVAEGGDGSCGGPGLLDGNALIRSAMSTHTGEISLTREDPTISNLYDRASHPVNNAH